MKISSYLLYIKVFQDQCRPRHCFENMIRFCLVRQNALWRWLKRNNNTDTWLLEKSQKKSQKEKINIVEPGLAGRIPLLVCWCWVDLSCWGLGVI